MKLLTTLRTRQVAALALVPVLLATAVHAGSFDARRVPADARWFAHVDVEGLSTSALSEALAPEGLGAVGPRAFGAGGWGADGQLEFDLLRDLKSFTVFGCGVPEAGARPANVRVESGTAQGQDGARVALGAVPPIRADAVAILVGRPKIDEAIAALAKRPEHTSDVLAGRPLHAWSVGDETLYAWVGTLPDGSRLIVQAGDKRVLAHALAVVEGAAPSLASAADADPAVRRPQPAEGSLLYVRASTKLAELGALELASNVARLAEDFTLDLGEARGAVFASLSVEARDERQALQIQQVLQGGIALLSLAAGPDADDATVRALQSLSGAFRFRSRGATVTADFELAVPMFLEAWRTLGGDEEGHEKK